MGRTLFYGLSKLGGLPAWLLAAGVAAGTTAALGYGAALWFERGERVSKETLKQGSRFISESVIKQLKDLAHRRSDRGTLRQRVREALQKERILLER